MILIAQMSRGVDDPAFGVGVWVVLGMAGYGFWALIRWVLNSPVRPDPWDDQVAGEIAKDDATPLCHRCLAPHDPLANFCPDCGAPVGEYTNLLPYPYVFSIGHTLRIGTVGEFKRS